jgi:hypothetical protein
LKEFWYAPLTLTIGRQDIWLGRGFLIGLNYQDPSGSIAADEFTAITSFDAVRATFDFDPWTVDSIFIAIDEDENNADNDHWLWVIYVNYMFAEYNAEIDAYWMVESDRGVVSGGTTGEENNNTHTVGVRGQLDPVENLTIGGEFAWQFGDYATTPVDDSSRDISAFGTEVFGEYRWVDHSMKPLLGLQYVFFSGTDSTATTADYEAWNPLFWGPTYGDIRDYQEVYYSTGVLGDQPAHTNQQHFAIYGDITPVEDVKVDAQFYWFWNDETISTTGSTLNKEIGSELDIHVTYDYTEDVAFGLGLAWFFPGDVYENGADDTATQVISSVSVTF